MKLSKVAAYFNNTKFYDAYSGLELGVGQIDLYDESVSDGSSVQRRVFEVEPGTGMPPRLVIRFHGYEWLVGATEIDAFKGDLIREKYVLHQAEDLAKVHTLKGLLQAAAPLEAYAARTWTRAAAQVEVSSNKFNQLQIFFSRAEQVLPNTVVEMSGSLHLVLEVYPAAAGHLVALSEELEDGALETATITTEGVWDRVTETYPTVSTEVPVVRLRWQSDFDYYSQSTPDFERGDMQLACMTQMENGNTITLSDGPWAVQDCQLRNEVYYLHLRRA